MARHGAHSAMSHTSARSQEDARLRTHSDSRRKKTPSDFFANALIIVGVLLMFFFITLKLHSKTPLTF